MSDSTVRAGGGIVLQAGKSGYEALLVGGSASEGDYRGFPKGKLEPGETYELAALREVREETGIHIELLALAGISRYEAKTRSGSLYQKIVYYYLARPVGGRLSDQSGERVDVRWVTAHDAPQELTYDNDRAHLEAALNLLRHHDLFKTLIDSAFTDDDSADAGS